MTYIANLDAHELNMGLDKKNFNDFIDGALHCTYDRGWLLIELYLYPYISDYVWIWFSLYMHTATCSFIIETSIGKIYNNKVVYRRF